MTLSTIPEYSRAQIVRWLGNDAVSKALAYANHVSSVVWRDGALRGVVKGSRPWPYKVDVYFQDNGTQVTIDATCSCPVGTNCKHAAAILLAYLKQRPVATPSVRAEVIHWLEAFRMRQIVKVRSSKVSQTLVYVLVWSVHDKGYEVQFYKASMGRDEVIRSIGDAWSHIEKALVKPPQFLDDVDLSILRLLWMSRNKNGFGGFLLSGTNGALALEKMATTGRLFVENADTGVSRASLSLGEERSGQLQWEPYTDNRQKPLLVTMPAASFVILVEPVWYVDLACGEVGRVALPWSVARIRDYLSMPPILPAEVPVVAAVLREVAPELPMPPVLADQAVRVLACEPVPVLHLDSLPLYATAFNNDNSPASRVRPCSAAI